MTATPLASTNRYIPSGVTQYYWVPTIANKATPTRAELDAGTDLTGQVAAVAGFTTSTDQVDVPDLGSRFTGKIPGRVSAEDSSLTVYIDEDDPSSDIRSLLPRDTTGFVVRFTSGDDDGVSGNKTCDVFPAKVTANSVQPDMDNPGQTQVSFSITSEPAENVLVPA